MACPGHDLGHGVSPPAAAKLAGVTAAVHDHRASLLASRVSTIIDAHPDALDVLIEGGFTPLANPVMRLALAHTVSLSQAFRLRGLSDEAEEALISRLLELQNGAPHATP